MTDPNSNGDDLCNQKPNTENGNDTTINLGQSIPLEDSTEMEYNGNATSPNLPKDDDRPSDKMDDDGDKIDSKSSESDDDKMDEDASGQQGTPLIPRNKSSSPTTDETDTSQSPAAENTPSSSGTEHANAPHSPNPPDLENHPQTSSDLPTTPKVTTENEELTSQEIEERQNIEKQFEQTIIDDRYRDYKKSSSCPSDPNKSWLNLQFHDPEQKSKVIKPNEITMTDPPESIRDKTLLNRIKGSIIGMAVGDALGAHVEFRPHEYLHANPVTDLGSGGTWGLEKGQFTDDTSMALCLANSLIHCQDFVPYDQLVRYKWWYKYGYMSSTGDCFDIGNATRESVQEFTNRQQRIPKTSEKDIDDYRSIGEELNGFNVYCSHDGVAGNGALMRLTPVPLFFFKSPINAVEYSGISGQITHGDQKSYDACRYYGALIVAALHGFKKDQLLDDKFYSTYRESLFQNEELHNDIKQIAEGSYKKQGGYKAGIRGKGYIVAALEAALWAFWESKNFKDGALAAVNLGDDTDTTAAIYGQLAGAYYGYQKLPQEWTEHVYAREFLEKLSEWIAYEGQQWYNQKQQQPEPESKQESKQEKQSV